jgi:hypothetical protein
MHETLIGAMKALGEEGLIFGSENRRKGEDKFQRSLGKKLEQMTESDRWSWRYGGSKEEKFETDTLANKKTVKVDIVGRHPEKGMIAIELKYVPASPSRGGVPGNPPAFPYDLAKDCLRLDLLRANKCTPIDKPIPDDLQTYVIGLTDWPDYWQDSKPKRGWAANFYNSIRSKPVPHFEGLIRTLGSDSENTIALGRCHIAFGRRWTGEWIPYGSGKQTERFRYLFLYPDAQARPEWKHHHQVDEDQSTIFPFLNRHSREGWRKRNSPKRRRKQNSS